MNNKIKHIIPPLVVMLIIIAIGIATNVYIYKDWSQSPIVTKNTLATKVTEANEKDLKTIIYEAQKNVVQIEAKNDGSEKIGSGFLYNNKGDIITNAHVVKDAEYITVKMSNAQTYSAALVGIGNNQDVALIRVPQLANQTPALVDENYQAEIGDEVLAVGSPLGFQNSVTLGIISGTNRSFVIDDFEYDEMYQITASITHGNSGGPLIDRATGKVVAINSAGIEEGSVGFSIPIHSILDSVNNWSEEANDKELVYTNPMDKNINPDQLKDDAEYIVNYFFESISIRDYINAYALLGSEMQTQVSYQGFREDYIHIVQNEVGSISSEFLENSSEMKVTVEVQSEVRISKTETARKTIEYHFTIGYENDQLKILELNDTERSSS